MRAESPELRVSDSAERLDQGRIVTADPVAQLVDDLSATTLLGITSLALDAEGTKVDQARETGREIARRAKDKGITRVVFDRGGYLYHGRVRALAEGAREAGLEF